MKRLLIILLVAVTGSAYAQKSETRAMSGLLVALRRKSGIGCLFEKGNAKESVRVVVNGNIEPADVRTVVSDGTLKVSIEDGSFNNIDVKVYVTYIDIDKLMVNSAATIFSENIIKCSKLTLSASQFRHN
jgi:hypothetical protein